MLKELVVGCLGVLASIAFLIVIGVAPMSHSSPAGAPTCAAMCAVDGQEAVTVDSYQYDVKPGPMEPAAGAGNTYLIAKVRFKNAGPSETHANPASFVLEDAAGVEHDSMSGSGISSSTCPLWPAVNLTPGASYGPKCIAFQATAGKPSPLTLIWTVGSSDHRIKLSSRGSAAQPQGATGMPLRHSPPHQARRCLWEIGSDVVAERAS